MSDETVKTSICPGMGVCHLETGVQVIIPMQIEPGKIVEALEAILNAVKNNIGEGIGCSQIASFEAGQSATRECIFWAIESSRNG